MTLWKTVDQALATEADEKKSENISSIEEREVELGVGEGYGES